MAEYTLLEPSTVKNFVINEPTFSHSQTGAFTLLSIGFMLIILCFGCKKILGRLFQTWVKNQRPKKERQSTNQGGSE